MYHDGEGNQLYKLWARWTTHFVVCSWCLGRSPSKAVTVEVKKITIMTLHKPFSLASITVKLFFLKTNKEQSFNKPKYRKVCNVTQIKHRRDSTKIFDENEVYYRRWSITRNQSSPVLFSHVHVFTCVQCVKNIVCESWQKEVEKQARVSAFVCVCV